MILQFLFQNERRAGGFIPRSGILFSNALSTAFQAQGVNLHPPLSGHFSTTHFLPINKSCLHPELRSFYYPIYSPG
jgi:hypothetical protein